MRNPTLQRPVLLRRGALGLAALASAACQDQKAAEASDKPAAPRIELVDVAAKAGLTLVQVSGDPRRWYIPESNGTGAAWLDYDGDGDLDLFLGNGQGLKYVDDGKRLEIDVTTRCALYRNDGGLRFTEVSEAAGCARTDWVQSIAVGDYDNDGDADLYLACLGADVLLRNEGGKFVDATAASGLGNRLWGTGAAFGDVNNDGALDLYVANYCLFDFENPPHGGVRNVINGVEVAWGPEGENKKGINPGAPDVFYLGDGKGHFRDATAECGLVLEKPLCSYAVVFSDIDGDGWQDILVANDMQPTNLFRNRGDGTFAEESEARGFALNAVGKSTSAMGLFVEDIDDDGDMDVLRTNFDFEVNSLHINDGKGVFVDRAREFGVASGSMDRLGWGGGFFDVDCDGDLDLLVANGHVYPQATQIGMSGWAMQSQLYEAITASDGRRIWVDATLRWGGGLEPLRSTRGVAFADADDDGDVDALLMDLDAPPRLLENRSARQGRWIGVKLVGTRSNRDGMGARVEVLAAGRTWTREQRLSHGLYSSHDPRLHFGVGHSAVERIRVRWPSGATSELEGPQLERYHEIVEPASTGAAAQGNAPAPRAETRIPPTESR